MKNKRRLFSTFYLKSSFFQDRDLLVDLFSSLSEEEERVYVIDRDWRERTQYSVKGRIPGFHVRISTVRKNVFTS